MSENPFLNLICLSKHVSTYTVRRGKKDPTIAGGITRICAEEVYWLHEYIIASPPLCAFIFIEIPFSCVCVLPCYAAGCLFPLYIMSRSKLLISSSCRSRLSWVGTIKNRKWQTNCMRFNRIACELSDGVVRMRVKCWLNINESIIESDLLTAPTFIQSEMEISTFFLVRNADKNPWCFWGCLRENKLDWMKIME
jgi:hypothetical protein